jgi:predicted GIY-YIG superfamily endonuclease
MNIEMRNSLLISKASIDLCSWKYNQQELMRSGVYIFRNHSEIQYVGCSKWLYNRLSQHLRPSGMTSMFQWTHIDVIFCHDYFDVEKFYINELKPKYNGSITGLAKIKNEFGSYTQGKRATFIIKQDLLQKVKAIAYWERKGINEIFNDLLREYISQHETQGIINEKLRPAKRSTAITQVVYTNS